MKFNVGTPDRIARMIIGAVLVPLPLLPGIALFASPIWFWASLIVGAVLIVTALIRFCPLYSVLGLSTRKVPSR
ncbi:YgaP family membrane protein [Devosia sp.]|uniref:YgaP family membrane protein n=1 Tax=Devosia sp. TaxID=1871048 RepID=UPI002FC653B3